MGGWRVAVLLGSITSVCWRRRRALTLVTSAYRACCILLNVSRFGQGYAFVEFVERAEAEQAQLYLDGGQVGESQRQLAGYVFGASERSRDGRWAGQSYSVAYMGASKRDVSASFIVSSLPVVRALLL